jgi:hypothetical protein
VRAYGHAMAATQAHAFAIGNHLRIAPLPFESNDLRGALGGTQTVLLALVFINSQKAQLMAPIIALKKSGIV